MKIFFTLLIIFLQASCFSQTEKPAKKRSFIDSVGKAIIAPDPKTTPVKKIPLPKDTSEANFLIDSIRLITPKLISTGARIDSRASSFQGNQVNIYGYYIGVTVKGKLDLGIGYYRINTILPAVKKINGVNTGTSLVVNCGSINSELTYYNRRFISLGFPLEFAFGQYNLTNTNTDNNTLISQQIKFLAFANFGLSGTFKPFKFVGLKLMAGYRKSIYPEEKTFEFNGVYSNLGLFVDFADFIVNIKMYKLMKRYHKVKNPISTYVDLFTD
ncbi:MAG TPA: hypothetical protein VKG26_16185 [Bacteroidia bacterium]|nr:hypothetical protein [Bacteroidia bacterium]